MEIEQSLKNTISKVDYKIFHSGKDNESSRGLSTNSDVVCQKCDKKGHIQRYCKSNKNGSDGDSSKKPMRQTSELVTNKTVVLYVEKLETSTISHNKKRHKWCIYCNIGNGTRGFYWKDIHKE